jgi:hypothetical protein
VTRIPAALAEWRNPRQPEFDHEGKTGWRLFNAVTEALKDSGYMDLPKRTQALHGLLDLACGLAAREPQLVQGILNGPGTAAPLLLIANLWAGKPPPPLPIPTANGNEHEHENEQRPRNDCRPETPVA